jgi:DNA-binding NtrC family response regulator
MAAKLLIIDDDANTLASLSRAFRLAGHEATVTDDPARALELAKTESFDVIFSDVVMPKQDGLSLLEAMKRANVRAPVVMMSGQAHIEMAVRATKLGAVDFLEKPISTDKLLLTVQNIVRMRELEAENRALRQKLGGGEIVFAGETMRKVLAQIDRVAPTRSRVCILGETGTGKELAARRIHAMSPRASGRFIALNCAAVPAELIESELFGHEKGSFTGAISSRTGKIEQADGGTLFLDEIGDMPLAMQAKLLRVLESDEVERIGGDKPIKIDVRVIAATHRDLTAAVKAGTFREDLYHRIFVFPIQLPPLRERREDISALVQHFATLIAEQNGWRPLRFEEAALKQLAHMQWPGNVRELRNGVERLALFAEEGVVSSAVVAATLPSTVPGGSSATSDGTLAEQVQQHERAIIIEAIRRNKHHISNTARELGLERSHLYKKCQQLGIDLRREGD